MLMRLDLSMSAKAKFIFKKAISWAGILFFGIAAFMIYIQLSKYEFDDIKESLLSIPHKNLMFAVLASFAGYVSLSIYDFLALKYIKKKLEAWKWIITGIIGFSVSNNAGHAIISGGSIRYRFYSRWGFSGNDIIKMVTFSGFTYLWACFFLIILGYFLTPNHAFGEGSISGTTTLILTIGSALGLAIYFAAVLFYKKPLAIKGIEFPMPSLKMALAQVFIGGADIVLASLVLYASLIHFVDISFDVFIGVFLVAQVIGVFSQVPGGLGVFESLFLYIIPGEHNQAALFGALIAYRIIYYLLPLLISGTALLIYERSLFNLKVDRLKRIKNFTLRRKNKEQIEK